MMVPYFILYITANVVYRELKATEGPIPIKFKSRNKNISTVISSWSSMNFKSSASHFSKQIYQKGGIIALKTRILVFHCML